MRRVKILVATTIMAFSSLVAFAGPSRAVVCIEDGGTSMCCEPIRILGKEYHYINC